MRLSKEEVDAIKEVVEEYDSAAQVYLYGSRAKDGERGGDIDLLLLSRKLGQGDAARIRYDLWERIGEQKIDILVAADDSHPFARIALREGIIL